MKKQLLEDIADTNDIEWTPPAGFDVGKIDINKVFELANRREAAAKQYTPCPKCGTMQVQLVDWSTDLLKMKCRHCKHKFEKAFRPTPVGCEAYCQCPACMGPGHEEWYAKGSPTLCTDGKVHYMTRPGYPTE